MSNPEPKRVPRAVAKPRYRVTLLGEHLELRGYVDGQDRLRQLGRSVDQFGVIIASQQDIDFNPFGGGDHAR